MYYVSSCKGNKVIVFMAFYSITVQKEVPQLCLSLEGVGGNPETYSSCHSTCSDNNLPSPPRAQRRLRAMPRSPPPTSLLHSLIPRVPRFAPTHPTNTKLCQRFFPLKIILYDISGGQYQSKCVKKSL